MKPWEVGRLFETHRKLLLIFEPQDAMVWLMREQTALNNQRPCALIETTEGYRQVEAVVAQLTDSAHV